MARVYREVIRCEVMREAVFGGTRSPLCLGQPQACGACHGKDAHNFDDCTTCHK